MGDEISNVRVDVGKLAKPIDTLIKKIGDATGVWFAPDHVRRMAKAKADAALIKAESDIAIDDLKRRTARRLLQEEMRNQENMEAILDKAKPLVTIQAEADKVEDDWMANFFAKCRTVSNKEMQQLWSKVLAGEVNKPGAFSNRAVNMLSSMDKREAELFTLVCCFSASPINQPLIYFKSHQTGVQYGAGTYQKNGLSEVELVNLDSIGLISFDLNKEWFYPKELAAIVDVTYFKHKFRLQASERLSLGNARFTKAGEELSKVVAPYEIDGFDRTLHAHWKNRLVKD